MNQLDSIEFRKSIRKYAIIITFFVFYSLGVLAVGNITVFIFLLFIAGFFALRFYIKYTCTRIILEPQSVRFLEGLINIKDTSIPYSKINSVTVDWVWCKAGDITISTSDSAYKQYYRDMKNIDELQNILNDRIKLSVVNLQTEQGESGVVNQKNQNNNIDDLERLALLKERGVISELEFDIEKQKILNR